MQSGPAKWAVAAFVLLCALAGLDSASAATFSLVEDQETFRNQVLLTAPAESYESVCLPKKAEVFKFYANGTFDYKPARDAYTIEGEPDVFSWVGYNVTVDSSGTPIKQFVTTVQSVNMNIAPKNDPPRVREGLDTFGYSYLFLKTGTEVVSANGGLEGYLRGFDPDSDAETARLTYTITRQPANGTVTVSNQRAFRLVMDPNSLTEGYTSFEYMVDDRQGDGLGKDNCSPANNYDNPTCRYPNVLNATATVFLQTQSFLNVPKMYPLRIQALEDISLTLPIQRTGLENATNAVALRYNITRNPRFGFARILCLGQEVHSLSSCSYSDQLTRNGAESRAYLQFLPLPDVDTVDSLEIMVSDVNTGEARTITYDIDVVSQPDPPVVSDLFLNAPLNYNKDGVNKTGFLTVDFQVSDSDYVEMTAIFTVSSLQDLIGSMYFRLNSDGTLDESSKVDPSKELRVPLQPVPGSKRMQRRLSVPKGWPEHEPLPRMLQQAQSQTQQFSGQLFYVPPDTLGGNMGNLEFNVEDGMGGRSTNAGRLRIDVQCEPGFFVSETAIQFGAQTLQTFQCVACPAGTRIATANQAGCTPCEPGTYSPGALAQCLPCEIGTYNPLQGQPDCFKCPQYSSSQRYATSLDGCFCVRGYYGQGGVCAPCLDQNEVVTCNNDGQRLPYPTFGHWVDKWATWQSVNQTVQACVPPEACKDSVELTDAQVWNEDTCVAGYTGRACAHCEEDYYRTGGLCKKCPSTTVVILVYWLLAAAVMLVPIMSRVFGGPGEWAAIHVALLFMQFNGLLQKLRVDYPASLRGLMEVQSVFFLDIESLHLECVFGVERADPKFKLQIAALIPVFAVGMCVVGIIAKYSWVRAMRYRAKAREYKLGLGNILKTIQTRTNRSGESPTEYPNVVALFVSLYTKYIQLFYMGVARTAISPFDCVEDTQTGLKFMESAPWLRCETDPSVVGVQGLGGFGAFSSSDSYWGDISRTSLILTIVYLVGLPMMVLLLYVVGNYLEDTPFKKALFGHHQGAYRRKFKWMYVLTLFLQGGTIATQTVNNSLGPEGTTLQILAMFFVGVFPYFIINAVGDPFLQMLLENLMQFFNFTNALMVWNAIALVSNNPATTNNTANNTANKVNTDFISTLAFVELTAAFCVACFAVYAMLSERAVNAIRVAWKKVKLYMRLRAAVMRSRLARKKPIPVQRWLAVGSKVRFMVRVHMAQERAQLNVTKMETNLNTTFKATDVVTPGMAFTPARGVGGTISKQMLLGQDQGMTAEEQIAMLQAETGAITQAADAEEVVSSVSSNIFDIVQLFMMPKVADSMKDLLEKPKLVDTWSNYGVKVNKAWVAKIFMKVYKFSEYKALVDFQEPDVTSFESKLKPGLRSMMLRSMVEREARADNVEMAKVLEMIDDLLGVTLDPELWNYGEAIREVAAGAPVTTSEDLRRPAPQTEEEMEEQMVAQDAKMAETELKGFLTRFRVQKMAEQMGQREAEEAEAADEGSVDLDDFDIDVDDFDGVDDEYSGEGEPDPYSPIGQFLDADDPGAGSGSGGSFTASDEDASYRRGGASGARGGGATARSGSSSNTSGAPGRWTKRRNELSDEEE
ncbi:unnamed protein product [Pedinophyceae sp. YPF-701]|nr:unnamed protein product [Pedinophyceae sp. YPF-701]